MLTVVVIVVITVASMTSDYPSTKSYSPSNQTRWDTNDTESGERYAGANIGGFAPKRDGVAVDKSGKAKPKWFFG